MNPVSWFEIYVDDMNRAKTFYEHVFKYELTAMTDPSETSLQMLGFPSEMNIYGAGGALVCMPGFEAGKNSVIIYFACDDCAVECQRAQDVGAEVMKPKFAIGEYGFISLIKDSEGNIIGLHSLA